MKSSNRTLYFFISVVLVLFFAYSGYQSYLRITEAASQQGKLLANFREWKSSYELLKPVQDRWSASYESLDQYKDVKAIYDALIAVEGKPAGVSLALDKLVVEKQERVQLEGLDLGATRVCLTTNGSTGLMFRATTFSELSTWLSVLMSASFTEIRQASFETGGEPALVINGFCLIMKD